MRVIETDNFGRDYPDEKFVTQSLSDIEAKKIAKQLNEKSGPCSDRFYKVEDDNYILQPGWDEPDVNAAGVDENDELEDAGWREG